MDRPAAGNFRAVFFDLLFQIWRRFRPASQWRLLWLFNSKFMVSAAGFVYDQNGRFLLVRHRYWVADVWGLPGGAVEKGETLEQAFSREVFEETGLAISHIQMIDFVSGFDLRMEGYFRSQVTETNDEPVLKLQDQEIIEARFFAFDELPGNLSRTHSDLIQKEFENNRSSSHHSPEIIR